MARQETVEAQVDTLHKFHPFDWLLILVFFALIESMLPFAQETLLPALISTPGQRCVDVACLRACLLLRILWLIGFSKR